MATCTFCGHRADSDDPSTYHQVVSWVHGPKLDGPVLREQTGKIAHEVCVQHQIAGQAPDQPELFKND